MAPRDEERFRRLVEEHAPAVGDYLRRRLYPVSPADLDDLVEETLIVVWRRLDDVPADAERPWMIGVARNVLRNARRSSGRRRALQASLRPAPDDPPAEERVVADVALAQALASLSDDDREIVTLNAWDGYEPRDLAGHLGITANAAAVRLSRARGRLRAALALGEDDPKETGAS